jgi:hypothetical protein
MMSTNERTWLRLVAVLPVASLLLIPCSCSRNPNPPRPEETRSMVNALKGSLRQVEGTVTTGDTTSIFTAWVDEKKIYLIREEWQSGPDGALSQGVSSYYLNGGKLIVYESRNSLRDPGRITSEPTTVDIEFLYSPTGELVASRKAVNGHAAKPEGKEIDGARRRFESLYPEVWRQSGL